MPPPDWIFFDCFNTVLDEADRLAGEHGMAPIAHLPVAAGLYPNPDAFAADYVAWRKDRWHGDDFAEIGLAERLEQVLGPGHAELIAEMVKQFETHYPATLTISPGVQQTLDKLRGHCRMGVVSNFFLPDLPARLLAQFGLDGHFDFILDSAAFGIKKPGVAIYEEALKLAGTNPEAVAFVGDSLKNDVLTPAGLGMRSYWYQREWTDPRGRDVNVTAFQHWDEFASLVFGDE